MKKWWFYPWDLRWKDGEQPYVLYHTRPSDDPERGGGEPYYLIPAEKWDKLKILMARLCKPAKKPLGPEFIEITRAIEALEEEA